MKILSRVLLVAGTLPLLGLMLAPVARAAPTLRAHASVEEETVRLGDLFEDAGPAAEKPVATAPRPGAKLIIGAIDLAALARDNGLSWMPETQSQRIVVERSGVAVPPQAMVDSLEHRLGAGHRVDLDPMSTKLLVPSHSPISIGIEHLDVDSRTGRLTAELSAPADSSEAQHLKVTGRVRSTVEVPVLKRPVLPGETVRAQDVTYATVTSDQVANGVLSDPSQIVGKVSRTMLKPEQPVRGNDVALNIVVHKGDLVRVAITLPGLDVATQGKALQDGAVGQPIRVLNTTSNITVEATVRGAGTVSVTPPTTR